MGPPGSPFPAARPRSFPHNASIALVGLRGVGKSTIGVIVSSTLRRRLIDLDVRFVGACGMPAAQYVAAHGWPAYRAREAALLADTLREHATGAVVVCSSSCIGRPETRALLQRWMRCHPVVHVLRRDEEVEAYVRSQRSPGTAPSEVDGALRALRRLAAHQEPLCAACSNFEFYNLWDKRQPAAGGAHPSSPTLKKVEQEFLRLLNFIFQTEMAPLIVWDRQTSHPMAATALEDRRYTYALVVPPSPSFDRLDQADYEELGAAVQAFDLRIDHLLAHARHDGGTLPGLRSVHEQFGKIRRQTSIPIIYHVATERQGGCFPASPSAEGEYFGLLHHGLRLGAEYLVVDLQCADERIKDVVASRGATKVIGSYFEARAGEGFGWDGPERRRVYDRAVALGCDIVRLSQEARSMGDNFAAAAFARRIRSARERGGDGALRPLVAFNTGRLGRASRCFNPVLSPVTHAFLRDAAASRPEQEDDGESEEIVPRDAIRALHSCFVFQARRFCIFGHDIQHSLSPAMHNRAYAAYGMPHSYALQDARSINELLAVVQDPRFGGASITLPFKLEIIPLLQSMSDHARVIGAVNTIVPIRPASTTATASTTTAAGRDANTPALHGDNTDWIGIRTCTLRNLTPANAITPRTTALIIGAGGIARASIYALQKLGVENIFLYNRTRENAEKIARYFNTQRHAYSPTRDAAASTRSSPAPTYAVRVLASLQMPWPTEFRCPSIIVSCVPAHSIDGAAPANVTLAAGWLKSPTGGVCLELAYKPRITPLLAQIRALSSRGWIGIDGVEVLPEQGFAQFEMFTNREAPRKVMRDAVEAEYARTHSGVGAAGG